MSNDSIAVLLVMDGSEVGKPNPNGSHTKTEVNSNTKYNGTEWHAACGQNAWKWAMAQNNKRNIMDEWRLKVFVCDSFLHWHAPLMLFACASTDV